MTTVIPDAFRDLLEGPVVVAFATVMPDGTPQVTPVWCSYDGESILLTSTRGRQKEKNVLARPRVSVLAVDPQDPLRWLEVRGVVAELTEEGAVEHIEAMSWLYAGKKYYGGYAPAERATQETRVLLKIKPTRVNTHS